MTLSNPESPMKHNKSQSHLTHIPPAGQLYSYNTDTRRSLERKGKEFNGSAHYDKASKKDLLSASSNFIKDVDPVSNQERADNHYERKQTNLHTNWTDQPQGNISPQRNRQHQIPTNSTWVSTDHNEKKGNPRGHEDTKNSFEKRADELSSQVLPASDYRVIPT